MVKHESQAKIIICESQNEFCERNLFVKGHFCKINVFRVQRISLSCDQKVAVIVSFEFEFKSIWLCY